MATRNLNELIGYEVHAQDGTIGPLKDLYFDDFYWIVRYLVVDLSDQDPGRVLLISPGAAQQQDNTQKIIPTQLSLGMVESSPPINKDMPIYANMKPRCTSITNGPSIGCLAVL
jgi:hypothetical protein